MGIILDLIIVAIIGLNIFICYKKGLVKLSVGLIAVFLAIVLALILYKPVSDLIIDKTEIDENIEKTIIDNFTNQTQDDKENESNNGLEYLQKYVDDAVNKTKTEIVTQAAGVISVKIINIASMIGIFLIVRILLILLTFVSDIITSLPILKQFNEVGGIIYGAVKALLVVYIILAIAFFVICYTNNTAISEAINSSYITKFFYEHNLLMNILFK